jgi:putative membrane protein
VAAAAGAVTLAAMIATPLLPARGAGRRWLSSVVVGGLWTTTTAVAARRWGGARTGAAAGLVGVATAAVEHAGTRSGLPFGRYAYTGALRPQVRGVPLIVPLAWWAMAVPAREAAHATLGRHSRMVTRIATGSAALAAWDLFLDPQMVGEGYWGWARRGRYRGIPLSNFAGWFVTGLGVMATLEALLPVDDDAPPDRALVAEYSTMAVMETVGFAFYFRDRLVAAVGGAAMLPPTVLALRRMIRG